MTDQEEHQAGDRWIEYLDIDTLTPNPENPKLHAIEDIGASMTRFGYIETIAVDERTGMLISGHGRAETLQHDKRVGITSAPEGVTVTDDGRWLVPVTRGWASANDDEARAFLVAANQLVPAGGWDANRHAIHIQRLMDSPAGLRGTGYSPEDAAALLKSLEPISYSATRPPKGGDGGGAGKDTNIDDWEANYRSQKIRSMVFDFPLDDHKRVIEISARLRKARGIEGNAELFLVLLREYADRAAQVKEP